MKLTIAKESHALCLIIMKVDHQIDTECIVDPGSPIIAMLEAMCHNLALIYDPIIQLNMQLPNSKIDQLLGLVRNVPCQIRTITIYLQMHMICDPAYDILLGRPFDLLLESVVRNFKNENQTITIKDPNNGMIITIPTMPRSLMTSPSFWPSVMNWETGGG